MTTSAVEHGESARSADHAAMYLDARAHIEAIGFALTCAELRGDTATIAWLQKRTAKLRADVQTRERTTDA